MLTQKEDIQCDNKYIEIDEDINNLSQFENRDGCSSLKNEIETVQEYRIFIHSSWLAVQSSYFRALLFTSGMKESSSKEIVLKVTENELKGHYHLIESMYKPTILDNIDPCIVLQVLTLAHKYDVSLIFKKCKYVLMSIPMSLELCESVLAVTTGMIDTDDLNEYLKKFLVNEFKPLDKRWLTEEFKSLSEVSLKMLLSSNELAVLSENTAFVALMSWCKYNSYNGPSLLSLLRPELMTIEFLHDVVYNNYLAKDMNGFDKLLIRGFRHHASSSERRKLLESEVTMRAEYKGDNEPSFTWQFRMSEENTEMYKSDHFWWCGFEMMLSLTVESDSCNIGLYVLNIEDTSSLNFVWVIEAGFPIKIRRQVTFKNCFHLQGYDQIKFPVSQRIQPDVIYCINIFIRFAISSKPVASYDHACDSSNDDFSELE